jgi:16S rRNA (adenine1518-N6/adenine1519-N6)-dimethyltransferase
VSNPRGGSARPPADRRLGQHHLVDGGTLKAILALASVRPGDVVLEVGAADGLLTRPLADSATAVHAFEVDARFAPALQALAAERPSVHVHMGDALKADLGSLQPRPTALVANLAYNIAIPLIVRSLDELPGIGRWAVMVQRELADRLFAKPRTKAYSAVSVRVQLCCELEARRAVPRTVFSPQPRVDSAFVVFRRRCDAPSTAAYHAVERLVRPAFSQRRKMMVNSLAGAAPAAGACGPAGAVGGLNAEKIAAALTAVGVSPTARAEELTPPQFVELAEKLAWL